MEHFFSPILDEDQKKQNKIKKKSSPKIEHFFSPSLGEDQKKRFSAREEHFFSLILGEDQKKDLQQEKNTFFPKFTLSCTPFQIIGGDAEVNHSQTIGGIQPNYGGGYIPSIPPGFRHH